MAQDPDSAGSQFFIMAADASHLDNEYAAFGKTVNGIEIVNRIVQVEKDGQDKPIEPQVMKKVFVDTFGETYDEPERI